MAGFAAALAMKQMARNHHPEVLAWFRRAALFMAVAVFPWLEPSPARAGNDTATSGQPENRQFDFWLGNWNVTAPGGGNNSTSHVYLDLDKCLLVESWDGGRGHKGENLIAYSQDDKVWHWLFADNKGHVHVFSGKVTPGSAEFNGTSTARDGQTVLNRVRVVQLSADKVEQTWEKSTDNGVTWTLEFRGEYSRQSS